MSFNQSTAGLRVLSHILKLNAQDAAGAMAQASPFLTYDDDKRVVAYIQDHLAKHGTLPSKNTILDQITVFLPEPEEPLTFDLQQLKNRFLEEGMRDATELASELIQEGKQPEALNKMLGRLLPLTHNYGDHAVSDIREIDKTALANYKLALAGELPPPEILGYPTIDAQGGIEDGDLIGIIGRPGSGKTWLMLNTALKWWASYHEPVLFVTQEMSQRQMERRILPLFAGVDPTPLYKGVPQQYELHGDTAESYMAKLEQAAKDMKSIAAPFLIYDSKMAGTIQDIENIASLHGCRRIWIDGAYMVRHPDASLGRYARVPENLDLLKQYCQRSGAAVFTSWQFKRSAGKTKDDNSEPDLDDIGYSHAIGEYCGIILGLLENPKHLGEVTKKKVSIMKGRNGEVGSFEINWRFKTMDFDEVMPEELEGDVLYL